MEIRIDRIPQRGQVQPPLAPPRSDPSEARGELRMDETQRVVEQLQRAGAVIETHADGRGIVTIWLKRPGTGRQPVVGQGPSFPAALSSLLEAANQHRL